MNVETQSGHASWNNGHIVNGFRVDWADPERDDWIFYREYENKSSALAYARRNSRNYESIYVVKVVNGKDVGQWYYSDGESYGFEG